MYVLYVHYYSIDRVQDIFALVFENLVHLCNTLELVGQVEDVLGSSLQGGEIVACRYRTIEMNT